MNDVSPIPGETCLYRMNYRFKHQFTGTAYQIGFLAAAAQVVCQDSAKSVFISIKKSHLTLRFLTQADDKQTCSAAAGMSQRCRYCCESRKSNCSENLAKVDF